MKIIIQLSKKEEAKAPPILLRYTPGMILPERNYALGEEAVASLRNTGIRFTQASREAIAACLEKVARERA
jgi:predicted Fe-Mo cluster-binding NifX family protein